MIENFEKSSKWNKNEQKEAVTKPIFQLSDKIPAVCRSVDILKFGKDFL